MSHYYDYTQDKIPTVVTIATPNRKDYVMDPHIKEYYNVYNTYDTFVQGRAGGSDTPNRGHIFLPFKDWSFGKSEQLAKEPNVVNVKIEQEYTRKIDYQYLSPGAMGMDLIGIIQGVKDNHSEFKNPETMQILQKEMEKRREK